MEVFGKCLTESRLIRSGLSSRASQDNVMKQDWCLGGKERGASVCSEFSLTVSSKELWGVFCFLGFWSGLFCFFLLVGLFFEGGFILVFL